MKKSHSFKTLLRENFLLSKTSNYDLILLVKVNIYHIDDYIICIMFVK